MSARAEIEAFRLKIERVKAVSDDRSRYQTSEIQELPLGLFKGKIIERFQKSHELIIKTGQEFFENLGVNFRIVPNFIDAIVRRGYNVVDYKIGFQDAETSDNWSDQAPFSEVWLHYDAGARFTDESLTARLVGLAVPKRYQNETYFELDKAIRLMSSPDADSYVLSSIATSSISAQNIHKLITLAVAGTGEIYPVNN